MSWMVPFLAELQREPRRGSYFLIFHLSHNQFSGEIPPKITELKSLQVLLLSHKSPVWGDPCKDWELDLLQVRDLSQNALSNENELKLGYELNTFVGIDLSGNIPVGIFSLQGLEYLNLSYNFLSSRIPALEVMHSLVALDLSHNSLSGQVRDNVSSLHNLTLLNLSYNCFSGSISQQQGYGRFPGAFAGNPKLCVESTGGDFGKDSDPAYPGETFEKEMIEWPISLWVFCLCAIITFYFSVISLFCSSTTRRYILDTKI